MRVTLSFCEWKQQLEVNVEKLKEEVYNYLFQTHSRAVYVVSDPIKVMIDYLIENKLDELWEWLETTEDWAEYLYQRYQDEGEREHDAI